MENNLKKIKKYYKAHSSLVISYFVLGLLSSILGLGPGYLSAKIVSSLTEQNFDNLTIELVFLAATYFFSVGFNFIGTRISFKLTREVNNDLNRDMVKTFLNIRLKDFYENKDNFFVVLTDNIMNLSMFGSAVIKQVLIVITSLIQIIIIVFVSPYYFIWIIGTAILLSLVIVLKDKSFAKTYKSVITCNDRNVKTITEIVTGLKEIKDLNLKKDLEQKMKNNSVDNAEMKTYHELGQTCFNESLNSLIYHISNVLLFSISLILVVSNKIDITGVLLVNNYSYSSLINLIHAIIEISQTISRNKALADRVFKLEDTNVYSPEKFGNKKLSYIEGNIEFNDVTFSYVENNPVLKNFTLNIPKNSITAFVGKSGEGKSTVLNLLTKDYCADNGSIYIDGVNINELSENALRSNIAIVSQSPYIFDATILENLRMVNPSATKKEIIEACKKAQIYDIINSKPHKFKTHVGSSGAELSGGQRQRLAIARALLRKSKIIIFDEATSALDNESQEKIKNIISELSKDHTILMVAHRLNTVIDADKIVVINNHQIAGEGTHEELLKTNSIYQSLYVLNSTVK